MIPTLVTVLALLLPLLLPASACPANDPTVMKDIVHKIGDEVLSQHKFDNLEQYFHKDYVAHYPGLTDGIDNLKGFLQGHSSPTDSVEYKKMAIDGDHIWTFAKHSLGGVVFAATSIFRFECGRVKEVWSAYEPTAVPTNNPHPFF